MWVNSCKFASANASSTVQPILMMTADHDPEFVMRSCPATASVEAKRIARVNIKQCFVLLRSHRTTRAFESELFLLFILRYQRAGFRIAKLPCCFQL